MSERILDIPSPSGRLAGFLHMPDVVARGAVLLMPAGLYDRVGPMRLYPRLARRLCAAGHAVLRYDSAGFGESEGCPPSWSRPMAQAAVRRGELLDEALAAAQVLRDVTQESALAVVGLGEGVAQAARLGDAAPHLVRAVYGIGAPTLVGPSKSSEARPGTPAHFTEASPTWMRRSSRRYLARAWDPEAWRRLWRGESDYRTILHCFASLGTRGRGPYERGRCGAEPLSQPLHVVAAAARKAVASADPRVDRMTWDTLLGVRAGGARVALSWGEHDPAACAFDDFLGDRIPEMRLLFDTDVIENGGYACAAGSAFEELARRVVAFLSDRSEAGTPVRNPADP